MNNKGLSLIESLISIVLLSALLIGLLGAFYISKIGSSRSNHRLAAVNILKDYLEREIRAKYDGGSEDESDFYSTLISVDPVQVTIDDRGTLDTADDLFGTIRPDPYFPDNIEYSDGSPIAYCGIPYKIIGLIVEWNEDVTGTACSELAYTYVAYHSTE